MYSYKTALLLKKNYDFSGVFPVEQERLTKTMGFTFNLADAIAYLKDRTKGFTKDDEMAIEMDKSVESIVRNYTRQIGGASPFEEGSTPVPVPAAAESASIKKLNKEIAELTDFLDIEDNAKKKIALQKEINDLKDMIEMESMEDGGTTLGR